MRQKLLILYAHVCRKQDKFLNFSFSPLLSLYFYFSGVVKSFAIKFLSLLAVAGLYRVFNCSTINLKRQYTGIHLTAISYERASLKL